MTLRVALAAMDLRENEVNMKLTFILIMLALSGCSSGPTKYLMKNCESLGSNLYRCEEVPERVTRERGR